MDIIFTWHFWIELARNHGYYIALNAFISFVMFIVWQSSEHKFWINGSKILLGVAVVLLVIGGIKTYNKISSEKSSSYNILSNFKN